ncbi:MAG: hypothetical protein LBQ54_02105 [Planctomycetaceae bacterium]|nr:hypothetical protein [Planctomycetaceae bacterium]
MKAEWNAVTMRQVRCSSMLPPAGRDAAAGDRLTLTPVGSPSVGKIFPT